MKIFDSMKRQAGRISGYALALVAAVAVAASAMANAGAMTDYLENALINHVFRATAYTAPANIYVGLSTTACSDSATGTEVTGGSYARVSVATGTSTWAATSGTNGTTSNSGAVNFATPSAGWGTVSYVVLYDALTSGNPMVCTALTTAKTINSGDTVSFPASSLTFQVDN